jgi:hypothetical protein
MSAPPSIKDDLLVRLYALAEIDIGALRTDLMARLEYHKDRRAALWRRAGNIVEIDHATKGKGA